MSDLVPAYTLPERNRRVLLVRRPVGVPQAEDFRLDEAAVDEPGEGRLLVRNLYLSVDPAQRGWANAAANYSEPVPLGSPMRALAVGVVARSRCAEHPQGSFVFGWTGWQDYAEIGPEQVVMRIGAPVAPLSAYAGALGINGLTAWIALGKLGRPVAGERVLVSTAAGAVGSVVGQLAREAGCHAVGLTGGDDKARLCVERFGYAAAHDYKAGAAEEVVARAAGEGIDVYFDNVGGPILDAALRVMRPGGRVVQCGTASIASWEPTPQGLRNEREVLTRRLTWSGFVLFDHAAELPAAQRGLEDLYTAGRLAYEEDVAVGMEAAPGALQRLYRGENRGKSLIFVG